MTKKTEERIDKFCDLSRLLFTNSTSLTYNDIQNVLYFSVMHLGISGLGGCEMDKTFIKDWVNAWLDNEVENQDYKSFFIEFLNDKVFNS